MLLNAPTMGDLYQLNLALVILWPLTPHASATSSRRASHNSLDSGGLSILSSASETCLNLDKLHDGKRKTLDMGPTCRNDNTLSLPPDNEVAKRPPLSLTGPTGLSGYATPPGLVYPPPRSSVPPFRYLIRVLAQVYQQRSTLGAWASGGSCHLV